MRDAVRMGGPTYVELADPNLTEVGELTAVDLVASALRGSRGIWQRALRPDQAMDGPIPELPRPQLLWRPAPGSHSIGRLLWHIADVEDRWLRAFIQGEAFQPAFGKGALDDNDDDSIPEWEPLMAYLDETRARTLEALPGLADRLSEERPFYGRSMPIGGTLSLMITHEASHAGQIAHIAGVLRRAGW